jgi:hypothetical protein
MSGSQADERFPELPKIEPVHNYSTIERPLNGADTVELDIFVPNGNAVPRYMSTIAEHLN